MKTYIIGIFLAAVILSAGCTSPSPGTGSVTSAPSPTTETGLDVPAGALPMNGHAIYKTPNTSFETRVDSFELGSPDEKGVRQLTIYIAVKNTGTGPLKLVWFSKLTDVYGNTYGGIGISHGGNGARSDWIKPNASEAARDYINIYSADDLATLSKGAVLDAYFMENPSDASLVSLVPAYHTSWVIDPGTISDNLPRQGSV